MTKQTTFSNGYKISVRRRQARQGFEGYDAKLHNGKGILKKIYISQLVTIDEALKIAFDKFIDLMPQLESSSKNLNNEDR